MSTQLTATTGALATPNYAEPRPGGLQFVLADVFEREGSDKPVCVAELVVRLYGGAGRCSSRRLKAQGRSLV
jgi:hypothetical protein